MARRSRAFGDPQRKPIAPKDGFEIIGVRSQITRNDTDAFKLGRGRTGVRSSFEPAAQRACDLLNFAQTVRRLDYRDGAIERRWRWIIVSKEMLERESELSFAAATMNEMW